MVEFKDDTPDYKSGFVTGYAEGLNDGSKSLMQVEPGSLAQFIYINYDDDKFAKFSDAIARLLEA
jgi:hypothetical protein